MAVVVAFNRISLFFLFVSQANALNCLRNRDLTVFADIVNEPFASDDVEAGDKDDGDVGRPAPDDHWINSPIPEEGDKTLLMVAVDLGLKDFVQVLLQAGANADLYNPELGRCPLHLAAQGGDLAILSALFSGGAGNRPNVNSTMKNGRTALHLAAEGGHERCLEFLLKQQRGRLCVDAKDKKGGQTALYLAAKKASEGMARMLIEAGADYNHKCFGKTVADVIKENLPGFDYSAVQRKVAPLEKQGSETAFEAAVDVLNVAGARGREEEEDLERFRLLAAEMGAATANGRDSGGYTLLQLAADRGLAELARILLEVVGADPNAVTEKVSVPPLLFAAGRGHLAVMDLLLRHKADVAWAVSRDSGQNVLHCILKNGGAENVQDYEECLKRILEDDLLRADVRKIMNKRDVLKNTPLHYATQLWSQNIIRHLLEAGANIGIKNLWEDIPITKIDPQTMEDFLDEYCVQAVGDVNHENFEVTYNYSFLAPPAEDLPLENREGINTVDPENQKLNSKDDTTKVALPETQTLWYMGQSKEHRHLLKHPVITSFLYLKWERIRKDYNRNLRFYLLFVYMLTWYIFARFGGKTIRPPKDSESAPTTGDTNSENKTSSTIPLFHGFFGALCLILLLFILRDWFLDVKEKLKAEKIKEVQKVETLSSGRMFCLIILTNWIEALFLAFLLFIVAGGNHIEVLWWSLLILTSILIIRELFQMTVSLKRYIFSPENWLELTVIILIFIILFHKDGSEDLKRHLSAVAIVFSWAELITLVGKHPKLTRYNVYVVMFYKVMGTFFFFLCWYSFFIIAFGLGFYIMLYKDPPSKDEPKSEEDEGRYIFFDTPWLALVKTSTMFVGELEFSDIPVKLESAMATLSYIFFLAFVFLIVVVLMNLLNGLAVSDTGTIQEKAEIYSYISRVDTISYTESILLGDPFNFLSNWPAFKWLKKVPSCSFCSHLYQNKSIQQVFHKLTGATGILLFYNVLPTKKLTLKPNSKRKDCSLCYVRRDVTLSNFVT